MYNGNEYLKWSVRCGLNAANHLLAKCIPVDILKTANARLLQHKRINLKKPTLLNEQILWNAYHTDTSLWSRLSDKYAVRKYVKQRGLEDILVPCYGVYRSVEEIPFEKLPDRFVMKATHGCDMTYICRSKNDIDYRNLKKKLRFWLRHNMAYMSLELHYAQIRHGIICEKLLEDPSDKTGAGLTDYKIFCIDGEARFIEVCSDRKKGPYLDLYDTEWHPIHDALTGACNNPFGVKKPSRLSDMLHDAEILAEGFPVVRVDLYEIDGDIYFGEMTFTPATGTLFHFQDWFLKEAACTTTEQIRSGR